MTGDADRLEAHYRARQVESKNRLRYRSLFESDYNAPDAPEVVRAPDSLDAVNRIFHQRGWTDGLPIVPPDAGALRGHARRLGPGGGDRGGRATPRPRSRREACGQRGDGGLRARSLPGGGGRDPGDVRPALQPQGPPVHHPPVHGPRAGERPARRHARGQRGVQRDGAGAARQRGHRAGNPAHPAERRRSGPRRARPGDDGLARQVLVLLRGERGREPLGAVARRERLCRRCEHGDRVRGRGPPQRQRPLRADRRGDPAQRRRDPRLDRGEQLLSGGRAGRGARPRARRGGGRGPASRRRT